MADDKQAVHAAREFAKAHAHSTVGDIYLNTTAKLLVEFASGYYASKLEAAEKMAETLKLMRECRHMKNCAGCTVRISESLAAWESTL